MSYDDEEEDLRLLGRHNTSKGVPLRNTKSSQVSTMHILSGNHGGARPLNTLDRSHSHTIRSLPNIRQQRSSIKSPAYAQSKLQAPLRLETIRGDNVNRSPNKDAGIHDDLHQQPQKKRKLNGPAPLSRQSNLPSPIETVDLSEPLPLEESRPSKSTSRTSSFSQLPSMPREQTGIASKVQEYRKVESMMDSASRNLDKRGKGNRQKWSFRKDQGSESYKSSSPPQSHNARQHVVDLSHDDRKCSEIERQDVSEDLDVGDTHNVSSKITQPNANTGGDTSHGWAPLPDRRPSRHLEAAKQSQLHVKIPEKKQQLNRQFVTVEGTRRGLPNLPSSPDELMAPTTVGGNAGVQPTSPNKRRRVESKNEDPAAKAKELMLIATETSLEPSNIPTTEFVSSDSRPRDNLLREAPEPWGASLAGVNIPSHPDLFTDGDLGIQLDEKAQSYKIMCDGKPFRHERMSGIIALNKLQKIIFSKAGNKVRFAMSKVQHESDNVIDIEFASKKGVRSLRSLLDTTRGISIEEKSSEAMDKMFQKRRDEPVRSNRSPNNIETSGKENGMSREVWIKQMEDANRLSIPKTKIVQDLVSKASNSSIPGLVRKAGRDFSQRSSSDPHETGIPKLLEELEPQRSPHFRDPALRRSTRASGRNLQSDDFIDIQNTKNIPEKYSEIHGLGEVWKRPVSYPRTGKKKATVDYVDLFKLDEGEFLNDAIVTFYMRYLEAEIQSQTPELANRVYFFSTFFYERLTDAKGKKEINYAAVQKWTKNVDIFTYDYLVIPINESWHWYLAIICNLTAINRNFSETGQGQTHKVECSDVANVPQHPEDAEELNERREDIVADSTPQSHDEEGTRESFAEMRLNSPTDMAMIGANAIAQNDSNDVLNHNFEVTRDPDINVVGSVDMHRSDQPLNQDPAINRELPEQVIHKAASISPKNKKKKPAPAITHTDPKSPLIITFDSLGSNHGSAVRYLKQYLLYEAEAKRGGMAVDVSSIQGINAKSIPQQNNFSDCGLYMLGYLDKFRQDGPREFVTNVVRRAYNADIWSFNASEMRNLLRHQLLELHKFQEEEYQAAKAERKKNSKEPTPSSPAPVLPPQVGDGCHDVTSESNSPKNPSVASATTREEALSTAKAIDDEPADVQMNESTAATKEDQNLSKDANAEGFENKAKGDDLVSKEDQSLIILESQDGDGNEPVVMGLEAARAEGQDVFEPDLPSQIADSQEAKQVSDGSQTTILGSEPSIRDGLEHDVVSCSHAVTEETASSTVPPPSARLPTASVEAIPVAVIDDEDPGPIHLSTKAYSPPSSRAASPLTSVRQPRTITTRKINLWTGRPAEAALPVSKQRQAKQEQRRQALKQINDQPSLQPTEVISLDDEEDDDAN